jgi:hypothetical protein
VDSFSISGGRSIFPKALFLTLSLEMIGCSSTRTEQPTRQTMLSVDVAPGTVLVDILESGKPEHYWQYEVRPMIGLVRKVKEESFQDYAHEDIPHVFFQPTGAIEACAKKPEANSPDGEYLAYCTSSGSDEFFVIDKKTSETSYHWKPEEWRRIEGFAWAPNSHSVAFLNKSSYYGKSPLELLSGLSGHPVPHDAIFLNVLDVRAWKITEYAIIRDVPYSFTRILNWSK